MASFVQHVIAGLADGGIYSLLALALVLVYRATGVLNFAQGEMGMVSTYVAWSLIFSAGLTYWLAFSITLPLSFLGGVPVAQAMRGPPVTGTRQTVPRTESAA